MEKHGWKGALIDTGWGRPDTFTIAAALAARTTTFEPVIAVRPGGGSLRTSPPLRRRWTS
jgi:alkanesulfonate monooxygenase